MKRIICALLILVLVIALTACGKSGESSNVPDEDSTVTASQSQTEEDKETEPKDETTPKNERLGNVMAPGVLYQFDIDEGQEPLIRGVSLSGNRAGSTEYNTKAPASEGIRGIFELNEWVDIYLDTDARDGLKLWVLKEGNDVESYANVAFSDEQPGLATELDLEYPEEGSPWGSFYLNEEEADPWYYDLVFTKDEKAVAVIAVRFYPENELNGKSDGELDDIINAISGLE